MPGIPERTKTSGSKDNNGCADNNSLAVLSNDNRPQYGLSYDQLEEFWCGLTLQARQKLMRINKQTLLENARKRMYCSRCNGLLLEGYLQIVMYGKSTKQDTSRGRNPVQTIDVQDDISLCAEDGCQDDAYDPSVHPWGGLTTARDETLTLLDCYICSKSLKGVQNVFDSAYARERDRELLYPDACGGTSRGWITQGTTGFGRGHVSRETCALHTARLTVRTLVDFWSALGEETRHSLMRMKEEDFIERLMYRFDNKRFCRDCRRNVIREFKELKELKRMRKEPRCTIWFCAADTDFQYEVSHDTVKVDWNQTFLDSIGTYHHFEWAIGTGEGKADILDFEDVGLSVRVQVNGLDLNDLTACYITLRAWKMSGRCNELCVKAHALRGQHCVHSRLVVGDGFVTITQGESIERFFEHAEEAEEEEDDDSVDKDGNEFDGECSRPQKHAKSPELAREFLLDAATVIFKEQVSKAFREGTTRQNAHIIFVSLALQLLEERLHVACKEIYTIENQMKLLEEEEKEKRKEEKLRERQERKRTKEREKKLRKKERLREKDKCVESSMDTAVRDALVKDSTGCPDDSPNFSQSAASEPNQASPLSSDIQNDELLTEFIYSKTEDHSEDNLDQNLGNTGDWNSSLSYDQHQYSRKNMKFHKDPQPDWTNWSGRRRGDTLADNGTRYGPGLKMGKKCQCSHICRCYHHNEHKPRPVSYATRIVQEHKYVSKSESTVDISKPYYRRDKYAQVECAREVGNRTRSYISSGNPPNVKKVWEPLDSQKKYVRRNSDSDVTLKSTSKVETLDSDQCTEFSGVFNDGVTDTSVLNNHVDDDSPTKSLIFSRKAISENGELSLDSSTNSSSNSDNCSSCLSEGDSNNQNLELASAASDSEESTQNSDGKETSDCCESRLTECEGVAEDRSKTIASGNDAGKIQEQACAKSVSSNQLNPKVAPYVGKGGNVLASAQPPQMHNQTIHYPVFQTPTISYYPQSPVSWPVGPANGLMSFPHANHYIYPSGFGYGLNGNAQFTQYGPLQHLAPPVFNPVHAPIFQPVPQFNEAGSIEETKVPNVTEQKEVQRNAERVTSSNQLRGPSVLDAAQSRKPQKTDKVTNGFSLFHFGGPVALSTGFEAEPLSQKGDSSPKKESMEEYNLFAASNGIKFDIF